LIEFTVCSLIRKEISLESPLDRITAGMEGSRTREGVGSPLFDLPPTIEERFVAWSNKASPICRVYADRVARKRSLREQLTCALPSLLKTTQHRREAGMARVELAPRRSPAIEEQKRPRIQVFGHIYGGAGELHEGNRTIRECLHTSKSATNH
jgi:hypothetical protein